MNIEAHSRALKESLEEIKDAVKMGVEKRQRTIGFHCSAAAADLLELWLHQEGLIDPGTILKHDMFASLKKAKENLIDFGNKNKILTLMAELEAKRNILVYGKAQPRTVIEDYLGTFNKIKDTMSELGLEYE